MLKTLIVLPDGTELFSGVGTENAIQSATITECVNGAQELTLGSTCANMIEAKIITPEGTLSIADGDEIAVYKVDDAGIRQKVGLFTMEKPTRESANRLSITAYDRVSWLDKDLTRWLAGLAAWPYSLYDFANLVCQACGLALKNTTLPNGDYLIQKFSADGITGRQLIQWVGEAAGRFCRATADGQLEFAWYTPADISIGTEPVPVVAVSYNSQTESVEINSRNITAQDDGEDNITVETGLLQVADDGAGNVVLTVSDALEQVYYYQNGLSFEDYHVAAIEKVQIRRTEDDVGTIYPDVAEAVNTYIITSNYLLTANSAETLRPVLQTLYEQLKDAVYTPCKVSVPSTLNIHAGNIVQITDRNGKKITVYVMTKTQKGQRDTLECTGSPRRDSTTAVNARSYQYLQGKVLNLRTDLDGLFVEHSSTIQDIGDVEERLRSAIDLKAGEIIAEVGNTAVSKDDLDNQLNEIKSKVSASMTSEQVNLAIQKEMGKGATKVSTTTGYTFDDIGLTVEKSNSEMKTQITEDGMTVYKNGLEMLRANNQGVEAVDLKATTYLIVGRNSRFEDMPDGKRTGCFWIGE